MRIKNTYKNDQVEKVVICKCGKDSLERIISDLSCRRPADTQSHIKKGGYHNLETYYDDYENY